MATIKFLLQSKSENSNIYVRLSIGRKQIFYRKTGFIINSKDWNIDKPKQSTQELKALKIRLDKLSTSIENAFNTSVSQGETITGEWLQ